MSDSTPARSSSCPPVPARWPASLSPSPTAGGAPGDRKPPPVVLTFGAWAPSVSTGQS